MSLGRPALRAAGNRAIENALKRHADLWRDMKDNNVPTDIASKIASNLVLTTRGRKAIWRKP